MLNKITQITPGYDFEMDEVILDFSNGPQVATTPITFSNLTHNISYFDNFMVVFYGMSGSSVRLNTLTFSNSTPIFISNVLYKKPGYLIGTSGWITYLVNLDRLDIKLRGSIDKTIQKSGKSISLNSADYYWGCPSTEKFLANDYFPYLYTRHTYLFIGWKAVS